jgi:hypothetical protein
MSRRTATGPNGEKLVLEGGKWVPLSTSAGFVGPIDEMTGPLPALGRTPEEQTNTIRQGLRSAGGTFAANFLSIPHATGELLATGAALPQTAFGAGMAAMRGEPLNLGERFDAVRKEKEAVFPASALLKFPDPTTEDVLAGVGSLGRSFSAANQNAQRAQALWRNPNAAVPPMKDPRIGASFAESLAQEQQRSADQPIATGAGRVGGDIATLLALQPGARATKALGLDPRAPTSSIARGLARTAEAGIDGAVIAALGEGDPLKTAAYSAGIQAGGSMALAVKSAMLRNPVKTFGALWLGHQMYKAVAPGPQQAFESSDAAIKELIAAYAAGTAAAMLGAGRGVGDGAVRKITDVMSTASRGTIASVISQLQEADKQGNQAPSQVLEIMGQNPDHFGADVRARLEKAATDGKLLDEVSALMGDEEFRKKLSELPGQAAQEAQSFGQWLMRTGGGF